MWLLDKKEKLPLFQQIINQIIEYIQNGTLTAGDKLPPERKLAELYQVNRSTVNHALEELVSLGWITRRQGSGTEVAAGRWGSRQQPIQQWRKLLTHSIKPDPFIEGLNLLKNTPDVLDVFTGDLPTELIPDFQFPAITWEQVIGEEAILTTTGYPPLKEYIKKNLQENFSLDLKGQDLLITSGSTQGIMLLLQTLLQVGDRIATEEPSFLFSLPLFQFLGIRVEGIPCDSEGIRPEVLEKQILAKKIKLLYLNPSFQNPTGGSMSLKRRQEVLALCQKYSLPIVEDDVFSELAFDEQLPKLKKLAPQQVIYLGSLSKIFGASIKIGWLSAPAPLIANLADAKQRIDADTTIFSQLLANTALRAPDYQQQHQFLLKELQHRSQLFYHSMQQLSEDWRYQPIHGGLYYWLTWKHKNLTRSSWQKFLDEKLLVAPSFLFSDDSLSMRINYTRMNEAQLKIFTARLQKISQEWKKKK